MFASSLPKGLSSPPHLYIEKYIAELPNKEFIDLKVATSDYAEQQIVLGKGAARISARELQLGSRRQNVDDHQNNRGGEQARNDKRANHRAENLTQPLHVQHTANRRSN